MRRSEAVFRAALRLQGFQSRSISTEVGEVHALEAQGRTQRPTLVFLHGLGSAGVHYSGLFQRLRPKVRRVVAPDFPAHGFSDRPSGPINPDCLLTGLTEALDELLADDEPAVIFGNSLGGCAAIRYAALRPHNVKALILCSPAGAFSSEDDLATLREVFSLDAHEKALAFIDRVFATSPPFRHLLAWGARKRFADPDLQEILDGISPDHALSPTELRALTMPVLFMWGEEERILPASHLEFYERHLPSHARVERPAGHGHSPYLERPDDVAARILRFVDEVCPVPAPAKKKRFRWSRPLSAT
ncbi:MAG: alpha/beta hydrolase [Myxococcota bacterium]